MTNPANPRPTEPQGLCRIVGVQEYKSNALAIYAKIIVEDEAGRRWSFRASKFVFELTPEPEEPKP